MYSRKKKRMMLKKTHEKLKYQEKEDNQNEKLNLRKELIKIKK